MSISTAQAAVSRVQKEIASVHTKLADKSRKEADLSGKINRLSKELSTTKSASIARSKASEIERAQRELASVYKDKAALATNLSRKTDDLNRKDAELRREHERERKRVSDSEKKQIQDRLNSERALRREIAETRELVARQAGGDQTSSWDTSTKKHDFFVSHASEDKDDFVRPLVDALLVRGCDVWYDEFQMKVGDSLRRSIDRGISRSRFGIVVLSESFFRKEWPQKELDGMTAIEINGQKVILPVWHKVTKNEVAARSPMLADKVALNSSLLTIDEIADALFDLLPERETASLLD